MLTLLLTLLHSSGDTLAPLPPPPPPKLAGTIALGWGLGATRLEGDMGVGWGTAIRSFAQWHPAEAVALRATLRSQEAISPNDQFRTHLVGAGLDGILQWPRGPFRPRLATGLAASLISGHAEPLTRRIAPHEDWTLHAPFELGAEWVLGPQFSLHLWGEAQSFQMPADLLDGLKGSKGRFQGRDELLSAGVSAAYRLDPARDADRDGVGDRSDRCLTSPEDRDGFQDQDGCPDPDNDGDGVTDLRDRCPNVPEDRDGSQDEDGCPDPDNDADGVPDAQDKCPNVAEDRDGVQDEDGCPDLDNDADGIADTKDRCPLVAEDRDRFQDEDGCPDLDNDVDGVADTLDACPNEAEDRDGFQDSDGCPESDNDRDGTPDARDRCPIVPESVNGFQDEDGCPDIALKVSQSMIADRVWFKEGTDEFLEESAPALQVIADWLSGDAKARIEVRGYTDDLGSDRVNQILSQKRAEAVRQALLSRGVSPDRVRSRGFGKLNPIASNRTLDGRARNKRIEIFRYE